MNQLTFDDRYLALSRPQTQNIERVGGRIGPAIIEFFTVYHGCQFFSGDLHNWVERKCGKIAPGSADRIMRSLKGKGINYEVVNRRQSRYKVL